MDTPDGDEPKPDAPAPITPAPAPSPGPERSILDEPAAEDRPESWGDRDDDRDDDWYLGERPPHHG